MGKWKELAQPDDIHTCHADCQNPACIAVRQAASGKPQAMKPTEEQVIAWARESHMQSHARDVWAGHIVNLESVATLAYEAGRKDENEDCAKACWEFYSIEGIAQKCNAAIRARREQ